MSFKRLQDLTITDVPQTTESPPTYFTATAKVVRVHNGDTLDLVFKRNGQFQRYKCRLAGVQAPELDTGGRVALKARDFLQWLCIGKSAATFQSQTSPLTASEIQNQLNYSKNLVNAQFQNVDFFDRILVILSNGTGEASFNDQLINYDMASV